MSYPLSHPVSVGDATEADQYNNLRLDALYMGNQENESGNLLQLLAQSIGGIHLTRYSNTGIRLAASIAEPCGLMISGKICAVTENTDLTITDQNMSAGRYFIYVVGNQAGGFSLATGSSAAPSDGRMIGTYIWDGQGIVPGTVRNKQDYETIMAAQFPASVANGRLTLAQGTPVMESDGFGYTVYFTPYGGNEIGLNVNGAWDVYKFTELSLPVSGATAGIPQDVFIEATRTGLVLSMLSWGSASSRLTPLPYYDGVPVAFGNISKRYLGTFVKTADGVCMDTQTARLIWNQNNRVPRPLLSQMSTAGPSTVSTEVWAPYNPDDCPRVDVLIPSAEAEFELEGVGLSSQISDSAAASGYGFAVGIGRDIRMTAPFTNNTSCVPVFTHSFGNSPVTVRIRNQDGTFRGMHRYSLIYWCNNAIYPRGREMTACGEHPGLAGYIMG